MKKFLFNLRIAATMVACIAATSLLWNCSSEDDEEPTNAVRLVKSIIAYDEGTYHDTYEYDAQNRLTTVYHTHYDLSSTATITYSDDRIFISRTRNNDYGSYSSTDTAILNSSGYIVDYGEQPYKGVFTYDDKGYLRTYNYYGETCTWLWENGNITTCSRNKDGIEYTYTYTYEDNIPNKPISYDGGYGAAFGHAIRTPVGYCHGWYGKSPVNLPSKIKFESGYEEKYRYVMDNKGYVKEVYVTDRHARYDGVWEEWGEEYLAVTITYY
jgi:hypothetical protein